MREMKAPPRNTERSVIEKAQSVPNSKGNPPDCSTARENHPEMGWKVPSAWTVDFSGTNFGFLFYFVLPFLGKGGVLCAAHFLAVKNFWCTNLGYGVSFPIIVAGEQIGFGRGPDEKFAARTAAAASAVRSSTLSTPTPLTGKSFNAAPTLRFLPPLHTRNPRICPRLCLTPHQKQACHRLLIEKDI
jgi:hypothetical protein